VLVVTGLAALEQWLDVARDESRARLIAEVDPRPSRHNHEAITKADQIEDVDEQPSDPRDKTAEPKPSDLRDCRAAADRRQRALVDVTKRLRRLAPNRMHHIARGVPSFLHSGGSQAGNRFAIRPENRGQVPNHEHARRAGAPKGRG
jgi:hypothetical protein